MAGGGDGTAEQKRKATLEGTTFNSLFEQPTIITKGTLTATTTPQTITHNAGGRVHVKLWAVQLSGEITIPVLVSGYTSYHSRYASVPNVLYYQTDNTLVVYTDISTALVYYRIYRIW